MVHGKHFVPSVIDVHASDKQYIYGWSEELKKVWRKRLSDETHRASAKTGQCRCNSEREEVQPDGTVKAFWHDGDSWTVSGLTKERLEKAMACNNKQFWSSHHHASHNRLVVKHKEDRDPQGLILITEQGKQIASCFVRDHESRQHALDHMKKIAVKYSSGEVEKEQLKPLAQVGRQPLHRSITKRPAASTPHASKNGQDEDAEGDEAKQKKPKPEDPKPEVPSVAWALS